MTSALSVSAMTLAGLTRGLCYAATVSDKRAVTSFISLNCPRSSRQANLLRLCRSTRARYYALPQFSNHLLLDLVSLVEGGEG